MNKQSIRSAISIGKWGAVITFFGTFFSGPISILLITLFKPQPAWISSQVFIENYHLIQSITFYFGFLLLSGSICIITSIYILSKDKAKSLLGLIFTSIGCGLIFFNYLTQNTFIPALVKNYSNEFSSIVSVFTMSNPISLAWALEMWGYGFLGIGTWLVSGFFEKKSIEKTAKVLFIFNGIVSLAGAIWTAIDLEWVYKTPGLISYLLWNVLYILLAIFYFLVLQKRESI
jgi:hypothetical protein